MSVGRPLLSACTSYAAAAAAAAATTTTTTTTTTARFEYMVNY